MKTIIIRLRGLEISAVRGNNPESCDRGNYNNSRRPDRRHRHHGHGSELQYHGRNYPNYSLTIIIIIMLICFIQHLITIQNKMKKKIKSFKKKLHEFWYHQHENFPGCDTH